MINLKGDIHKQIVNVLKTATLGKLPVYHKDTLVTTPVEDERIEYEIGGAFSTGTMYRKYIHSGTNIVESTVSEYGSTLTITVTGTPDTVQKSLYQITGLIQSTDKLESLIGSDFELNNETLVVATVPVNKNGVIYFIGKIRMNMFYAVEYDASLDYFTHVEDADFEIQKN